MAAPIGLVSLMGAFFLLALGLHKKLVGLDFLENRGFSTMGLPCMQCNESFSPDEIFECLYCDEGIYFFCTKECSDKWMSVNAQELELENQQQATS